jgi:nucleotide-binding universal stress UspA family protein
MTKPILAGYDPQALDYAPVEFGVTVAKLTRAPLVVASVEGARAVPAHERDPDLLDDCTAALEHVEPDLRAIGVPFDCIKLESSSAARALHEEAEKQDAGLLAVGSSRRSGAGRVLAGSTAHRLLHGAPCPVAVVPRSWVAGPLRSIGVAYADSDDGREALRGAHALARRAGAKLRVITVVKHRESFHLETDPPVAGQLGDKREVVDIEGEHRLDAERGLLKVVEALGDDVAVEAEALVGDPAEVIVDFSDGVDLLVCGSRGYGPARGVLLGSVSLRVMEQACCPVIVLPRGVEAALEDLLAEAPGAATPA